MTVTAAADGGQYRRPDRPDTSSDVPGSRAEALARAASERTRRHRFGRLHKPSALRVALAIPRGHVRADDTASWLADVTQHPAIVARRADAQANILAVARAYAAYARWESPAPDAAEAWQRMTTRPGWDVVEARTGLRRSTVAAHTATLREAGLLGIVATGTTPDLSPGVLAAEEGNSAAVYVLMRPIGLRLVAELHPDDVGREYSDGPADWTRTGPVLAIVEPINDDSEPSNLTAGPAPDGDASAPQEAQGPPPLLSSVDRSWTPSRSLGSEVTPTRARARRKAIGPGLRPGLNTPPPLQQVPGDDASGSPWPLGRRPLRRDEMRRACLALSAALPVLARISPEALRSLIRPLFVAGWTPADVVHAIGHRPDGRGWHHAHDVAHVPGWLRHRLAPWHVDGIPRRGHSQQLAAAAREHEAARRAAADRATAAEQTARAGAVSAAAVPALVEQLAILRARHRRR